MIRIKKIQIKRYRSINDLTLNIDESYNISTICGRNNVGKTNVLRAIALFFNEIEYDKKIDMPERKQFTGGSSKFPVITIWFEEGSDKYEISKNYDTPKESKEDFLFDGIKNGTNLTEKEIIIFLKKIEFFYLESINISFPKTIGLLINEDFFEIEFGKTRLSKEKKKIKDNLVKAQIGIQKVLNDLVKEINPIFKEFENNWGIDFDVPKDYNRFRELLSNDINFRLIDDTQTPIQSKGSGLQRLAHILINLRIIQKLSENGKNCILLIDEPDIYLHSGLQKILKQKINELSSNVQIFITTHSKLFIDTYTMKNVFLLDLDVEKKYSKRKEKYSNDLSTYLIDYTEVSGQQKVKNSLGIQDDDYLSISPVNIIVEGREDVKYLSSLFKVFGFEDHNFIPAGGAQNIKNQLQHFNFKAKDYITKPYFKIIFDNDVEGRDAFDKVKEDKYPNIKIYKTFIIDCYNTDYSDNKPNIEIEDFIYPEIILNISNNILTQMKLKKVSDKDFFKMHSNKSVRHDGVLKIFNDLKNGKNDERGLELYCESENFKKDICKAFNIEGNINLINQIRELDSKYPEVKKFLEKITNA
ncbi:MAG: hypothetical protein BGO32_02370 [Bacteroidetes bacterium 37-13]|nr:MAG: hypothetical protein BGO32_02370 [Bacteroidetes bacterium 37-13]